jgi:hypothetical protein
MADPAITQQKDAVEYGAQGAVDAQAAAMTGGVPPVDPAAIAQSVVQSAENAPAGTGAEGDAPVQNGYTVKNPYMLLPSKMNFGQFSQDKTPLVANHDMSLFWDILASDQQIDPTVRIIADSLKGR